MAVKRVTFHGDSLDHLHFPKKHAGRPATSSTRSQKGRDPSDWKPMPTIGASVREIKSATPRERIA